MLAICIITQNMNFTSVCKYDCVKGGTLNLLYKKFNFVFGGVINIFIMELILLKYFSADDVYASFYFAKILLLVI